MDAVSAIDESATIRTLLHLEDQQSVITRQRFSELSRDLGITSEELDIIFVAMDTDCDDVISLDELLVHWNRAASPSPAPDNVCNGRTTSESLHDLNYPPSKQDLSQDTSDQQKESNCVHNNSDCLNRPNSSNFVNDQLLLTSGLKPAPVKPSINRISRKDFVLNSDIIPSSNQIIESPMSYGIVKKDSGSEIPETNSVSTQQKIPSLNVNANQTSQSCDFPSSDLHKSWTNIKTADKVLAGCPVDQTRKLFDSTCNDCPDQDTFDSVLAVPKTSSTIRKMRAKSPRPGMFSSKKLVAVKEPVKMDIPGIDLSVLSFLCQEQVCELYQNLHGVDKPELVTQFENILLTVINDVRQFQMENERLEKSYRREKDAHAQHLRRLEEEMEQQVQSVEERVRKEEKEKLESEKIELRNQLDSEIIMLQQNLKKLQQEGENKMDKGQEEHLLNLKKRLEEIHTENRMLKSELTDAQTDLALIRSQMTTVKQQLEEKNYELEVGNKTMQEYLNEQEKLTRQIQLLNEANKNLLDTNDNLREMLDSGGGGSPAYKRATSTDSGASAKSGRSPSPSYPRKGSVMSDYVDSHPGNRPLLEAGMMPRFLSGECDEDAMAEDLDSGHSTLRDVNDVNDDTEIDSVSVQSDVKRGKRHKRLRPGLRVQEEDPDSHDEMDTDTERPNSPELDTYRFLEHKRSPSIGSRGSNRSQRSLNRDESVFSQSSKSSRGSMRRQLPAVPSKDLGALSRASKEPERMYKIVLAGDAAVGKSSFIVRLCKGKFVPNLSSTLGVDFQTKMLDVDGHPTALQLWDTAGQERFRSVARTYFRRADGVLLLYDVTYERSFLNLREWVDAIEEGSLKKVPIMLVGNKTDARAELEQQGRRVVKKDDGVRLSRDINSLFIETSAKDGANITEAVIELTRLLRTNEDMEVKTVGMQLTELKDKKAGSCCKRS